MKVDPRSKTWDDEIEIFPSFGMNHVCVTSVCITFLKSTHVFDNKKENMLNKALGSAWKGVVLFFLS